MSARIWKMVVVLCALGLSQPVWSQTTNEDRESTSQTSLSTTVRRGSTQSPELLAALATSSGILVFKFNITALSPIPKNGFIGCQAEADVSEPTTGTSFVERAFAFATLVSGNTWSCSPTIHYAWPLSSPSTDKVTMFEKVEILDGIQVTATNGTALTVVAPVATRHREGTAGMLASVPLGGSTTTVTVNATL